MSLPKNRIPTHPGEVLLEEFLVPMGISQVAQEYIRLHGQITSADYVWIAERKITQRTAQNEFFRLEKMGLLRQVGS